MLVWVSPRYAVVVRGEVPRAIERRSIRTGAIGARLTRRGREARGRPIQEPESEMKIEIELSAKDLRYFRNCLKVVKQGAHATDEAVRRQLEAGIHVGNNGEQCREGFFLYLQHRLSGFGGSWQRMTPQDLSRYPQFQQQRAAFLAARPAVSNFSPPEAIADLAAAGGGAEPFRWVLCDLNGESYRSYEWGMLNVHRAGDFADPVALRFTADCVGDVGAVRIEVELPERHVLDAVDVHHPRSAHAR